MQYSWSMWNRDISKLRNSQFYLRGCHERSLLHQSLHLLLGLIQNFSPVAPGPWNFLPWSWPWHALNIVSSSRLCPTDPVIEACLWNSETLTDIFGLDSLMTQRLRRHLEQIQAVNFGFAISNWNSYILRFCDTLYIRLALVSCWVSGRKKCRDFFGAKTPGAALADIAKIFDEIKNGISWVSILIFVLHVSQLFLN